MSPRHICYDTEFLEDGSTIDLISIGLVDDSGREYYAVNADCDFARIREVNWLWENVVPLLPTTKSDWNDPQHARMLTMLDRSASCVKPKWVIANEVRDFILEPIAEGDSPRLWAYFGAYDHVALAQLYGPMIGLPKGIPMWTHELNQLMESMPGNWVPPKQGGDVHNALDDARWNLRVLREIQAAQAAKQ